jgi:hypothetical protein
METDEGDTDKLLAEAAGRIRRDAFAAGFRAAVEAMTKALSELPDQPEGPADAVGLASGAVRTTAVPASVTVGSTPWYVLQAITKRPGMTGADVVTAVREGGHSVTENSIRTSIARLGKRRLIVSRHRKWFPA